MKRFNDTLFKKFGYDRPFLSEDIITLFPQVTRGAVYQNIENSIAKGQLERYKRGVYYIPTEGVFGRTFPSAEAVVERMFLTDGDETFGYYSGLTLENKTGISNQVPAVLEVTTNKASKRVREIEAFGGWRKIILRKPRTRVNSENVDALMLLDLLTAVSPSRLDGYELKSLRKLARRVGRDRAVLYAKHYPAKTSKRLIESEEYNVFA